MLSLLDRVEEIRRDTLKVDRCVGGIVALQDKTVNNVFNMRAKSHEAFSNKQLCLDHEASFRSFLHHYRTSSINEKEMNSASKSRVDDWSPPHNVTSLPTRL